MDCVGVLRDRHIVTVPLELIIAHDTKEDELNNTGALNRKISARLSHISQDQNASYGLFFTLGASVFFLSLARVLGSAILDTFR